MPFFLAHPVQQSDTCKLRLRLTKSYTGQFSVGQRHRCLSLFFPSLFSSRFSYPPSLPFCICLKLHIGLTKRISGRFAPLMDVSPSKNCGRWRRRTDGVEMGIGRRRRDIDFAIFRRRLRPSHLLPSSSSSSLRQLSSSPICCFLCRLRSRILSLSVSPSSAIFLLSETSRQVAKRQIKGAKRP